MTLLYHRCSAVYTSHCNSLHTGEIKNRKGLHPGGETRETSAGEGESAEGAPVDRVHVAAHSLLPRGDGRAPLHDAGLRVTRRGDDALSLHPRGPADGLLRVVGELSQGGAVDGGGLVGTQGVASGDAVEDDPVSVVCHKTDISYGGVTLHCEFLQVASR